MPGRGTQEPVWKCDHEPRRWMFSDGLSRQEEAGPGTEGSVYPMPAGPLAATRSGQSHVGVVHTCGTGILPVRLCGIGILPMIHGLEASLFYTSQDSRTAILTRNRMFRLKDVFNTALFRVYPDPDVAQIGRKQRSSHTNGIRSRLHLEKMCRTMRLEAHATPVQRRMQLPWRPGLGICTIA